MKRWVIILSIMAFLYAQDMDWRTYQHDNERTGFTPYKGGFHDTLHIMWYSDIGRFSSIPVVVGDVDNDNEMEIVSINVGTFSNELKVRDAKTGTLEWVYYFPDSMQFGGSVPVIEDINNDGINEIIVSNSYWDPIADKEYGRIYVLDALNQDTLWCFRNDTMFFTGVAVQDVDGDGSKKIVFGAGNVTETGPGYLSYIPYIYILNNDGSVYWIIDSVFVYKDHCIDYPIPVGSYPVLGDLNGDGVSDIVGVKLHSDSTWHLCGIDAKNKTILWENDYSSFGQCISDLDNDGMNEIVTSFYNTYGHLFLRCFEGNSGILKWEYHFVGTHPGGDNRPPPYQPAIGDLDRDGNKEVVFVSDIDTAEYEWEGTIFILNKDGNVLYTETTTQDWVGSPSWTNGEIYYAPVIADVDNDDTIEVLIMEYHSTIDTPTTIIKCINGISYETEWQKVYKKGVFYLQLADVDDDSLLEIVALAIVNPLGWASSGIIVFNESVDIKEKYRLILLRKNKENKFIYNISGRKFLKNKLKNLPPGIYFSPFEKKKYLKILKRG